MTEILRLSMDDRIDLLRRTGLFAGVPMEDLGLVAETASICLLDAGDILFELGDVGDAAYVVASGLLLGHASGGVERVRFQAGDLFGEYALFAGNKRTLTVTSLEKSMLLKLSHERMEHLMRLRPEIVREILQRVIGRLLDLEQQMQNHQA